MSRLQSSLFPSYPLLLLVLAIILAPKFILSLFSLFIIGICAAGLFLAWKFHQIKKTLNKHNSFQYNIFQQTNAHNNTNRNNSSHSNSIFKEKNAQKTYREKFYSFDKKGDTVFNKKRSKNTTYQYIDQDTVEIISEK